MKKLLFALVLFPTVLWGQKPYFYFSEYTYSESRNAAIKAEIEHFTIPYEMTRQEKKVLHYIQEKKQLQEGGKQIFLDFDKDDVWDLLLIEGVYFGPTSGYQFYVNTKAGVDYACENSGDIVKIKKYRKAVTLYHLVPIIDVGESGVLYILHLNFKKRSYDFRKIYYAQQSILPAKISNKPKKIKIQQKTALRFSPEIRDKGTWIELAEQENEEIYRMSKTIRGNTVAYYEKGAECLLLTENKEGNLWLFCLSIIQAKMPSLTVWKIGKLKNLVLMFVAG